MSQGKRIVLAARPVGEPKPSDFRIEEFAVPTPAAGEVLLRTIWHLQLAGFQAGRQRNPSGALSNDKLTIFIDGAWHAYDVFNDLGAPGVPMKVQFWEVAPANYVPDPGIPD